jgi:hypothetical protein
MAFEDMQAAGVVAREEFEKIFKGMSAAEKKGAQILVDWVRKSYKKAGYKQLLSTKYGGLITTIATLEKATE